MKNETTPSISGGLLNSTEVMQMLKISSRTLQNYRDKGIVPFIKVTNKKIVYDQNQVLLSLNQKGAQHG